MKKLVLTVAASVACMAAFGQGKIGFQTDSLHLVYFDSSAGAALTGLAATSANAPAPLAVDLYLGTSSGSLTHYGSSASLFDASNPGKWSTVSVATSSPFIAGGTTVYVVAQVRDAAATAESTLDVSSGLGSELANTLGFSYYGWSQEFTFTLGSSVNYPAMYAGSSTWQAGTVDLSSSAGAGAKGAIAVYAVPEPATFALAGLGMAGMLIFRRRKA